MILFAVCMGLFAASLAFALHAGRLPTRRMRAGRPVRLGSDLAAASPPPSAWNASFRLTRHDPRPDAEAEWLAFGGTTAALVIAVAMDLSALPVEPAPAAQVLDIAALDFDRSEGIDWSRAFGPAHHDLGEGADLPAAWLAMEPSFAPAVPAFLMAAPEADLLIPFPADLEVSWPAQSGQHGLLFS